MRRMRRMRGVRGVRGRVGVVVLAVAFTLSFAPDVSSLWSASSCSDWRSRPIALPTEGEAAAAHAAMVASGPSVKGAYSVRRDAARSWWTVWEREQGGVLSAVPQEMFSWAHGVWSGCGYVESWDRRPAGRRAAYFGALVTAVPSPRHTVQSGAERKARSRASSAHAAQGES